MSDKPYDRAAVDKMRPVWDAQYDQVLATAVDVLLTDTNLQMEAFTIAQGRVNDESLPPAERYAAFLSLIGGMRVNNAMFDRANDALDGLEEGVGG